MVAVAKVSRRHEEYQQVFTEDDVLLVTLVHVGSSVTHFSVQYIARIDDEWYPIVRYDTAHGRAHVDVSHPDKSQETRELTAPSYREALTMAIADVKARWEFYRERYERWMK